MRKIKIFEHISLDGIIQPDSPDEEYSHGGWIAPYRTPAGMQMLIAEYGTGYDLLLGRRTYDLWSGIWPKATGSPFAEGINAATKYIATHRPESLAWGPFKGLGPDIVEDVRRIKAENGPDLIVSGSATVASTLLEHGLADQLILIVYPVLLGKGKHLFKEDTPASKLALVGTQATPTGAIINAYTLSGALDASA